MHELLGDILPVRLTCGMLASATLGTAAADLRGMTQMMMDLAAEPELMHRLMAYLRDAALGTMEQVAATGLLTPNNLGPMTCSDPIGEPDADGSVGYQNMWCMANSQEFQGVGPAMWREFLLEYQRPIIEQFGLSGYGCCENLTHKIDGVLSLPNLRIFVCSAWTYLEAVQEAVGQDYVIMWRQKASDVVFPDDVETIRRDLEEGCKQLQGYHYQIVLRELQTLERPSRPAARVDAGRDRDGRQVRLKANCDARAHVRRDRDGGQVCVELIAFREKTTESISLKYTWTTVER